MVASFVVAGVTKKACGTQSLAVQGLHPRNLVLIASRLAVNRLGEWIGSGSHEEFRSGAMKVAGFPLRQ